MNIKPYANMVVVERLKRETETKSGILLTEGTTERPSEGTVLAIGTTVKYAAVQDIVLFNKYAGSLVQDGKEEYLILSEEDIYGSRSRI